MSKFFEKIFGKKKKEEVANNINSQNNVNEQRTNNDNQNMIQPEPPITFNQNMNIENQTVNPLGFQPTTPTDNIQNNLNAQQYNLNAQPVEFNNPVTAPQQPMMNTTPQPIQNQTPIAPQPVMPSNEVNNVVTPQPITFNQELMPQQPQQEVLNVIPTLGPTPNPTIPNQNNGNNQNM